MKVLILAYDFPPLISIGGQRPYSWLKYLPDSGISVKVITRHWDKKTSTSTDYVKATSGLVETQKLSNGNEVIRSPFSPNLRDRLLLQFGSNRFVALRKLLTLLYSFFEHLFFMFDSKAAIYSEAEKAIEAERPDLIIATGEPFILFKYAHQLSSKYDIPWVADYRDGWTSNQGSYQLGALQKMQLNFFRSREVKYVSNAALITTASPTYVNALKAIHPDKKIEVIYNGFDDEFFGELAQIQLVPDKFIISYAGTIYPHQNIEMFLDGLQQFVSTEKILQEKLEIRFYGIESQPEAKSRLLNYRPKLKDYIKPLSKIPYADLIKELRRSNLLLLLSKKGADWLNAKVFDYLGVKREIMLVQNDQSVLQTLLSDTSAGVGLDTADEVAMFLKKKYTLHQSGGTGEAGTKNYLQYSRKAQAGQMAKVLQTITTNRKP